MSVRRMDRRKAPVARDGLNATVTAMLEEIQSDMLQRGREFLKANTRDAGDYDSFKKALDDVAGFFRAGWCGSSDCEKRIKDETKATIRCVPLEGNREKGKCLRCGSESQEWVYFARSY